MTHWANFKHQVYHECMAKIFESIVDPSHHGMLVACADGVVCHIYPFIQDASLDMEEM